MSENTLMSIQVKNLEKYNELIRTHKQLTKKLEDHLIFPFALLDIQIEDLQSKEYSILHKHTGAANTSYIVSLLRNFEKRWVVGNQEIYPYSSLNLEDKQDKLIADITSCFEPSILRVAPMSFFTNIEKHPFLDPFEPVAHNLTLRDALLSTEKYGLATVPCPATMNKAFYLALYLFTNEVAIKH